MEEVPVVEEYGPLVTTVGTISNKFSAYDGMTDEEAEEFKRDLDERLSRRIPAGFAPGKKARIGGRRAGSFPKIRRMQ